MKNFFLQIVNKSQGEIIKYKQAYEQQRERRKECEAKLTEQADMMQKDSRKHYEASEKMQEKLIEQTKAFSQQLNDKNAKI